MKTSIIYIIVGLAGFMLAYNINLRPPIQEVKAAPQLEVLPIEFSNKFKLDLDLSTGKAQVESNHPFTKADVNVYHPVEIKRDRDTVRVPKYIKRKEAYEEKVVILEKFIPLSMPIPSLDKPRVPRVDRFER